MGKKNKDQEPVANIHSVSNRDIIQRINFLYQASTYLSTISHAQPAGHVELQHQDGPKRRKKNSVRHPKDAAELSRSYVNSMRIVGQKTMVRMDPSIKRTLCKGCDTVLLPGSTASVRVKPSRSHGQAVVYTCLSCNTQRLIPAPQLLDPDAPVPQAKGSSSGSQGQPSASTTAASSIGLPGGGTAMDVDSTIPVIAAPKKSKKRRRIARVPPLFERKGHVIFRGNEMLIEQ